jgi:hypothetical protein
MMLNLEINRPYLVKFVNSRYRREGNMDAGNKGKRE